MEEWRLRSKDELFAILTRCARLKSKPQELWVQVIEAEETLTSLYVQNCELLKKRKEVKLHRERIAEEFKAVDERERTYLVTRE